MRPYQAVSRPAAARDHSRGQARDEWNRTCDDHESSEVGVTNDACLFHAYDELENVSLQVECVSPLSHLFRPH